MINNLFFWGAKFKAGIIHNLIENNKILTEINSIKLRYIFDPNLDKPQFSSDAKFSNDKSDLEGFFKSSNFFVVCIGNELGFARYSIAKELEKQGIKPLDVISKNAYFEDKKLIGKGVQLFPNSIIQSAAKVGDYCILNTGSILEHDCEVGNGVHLMPGAVVGGNVVIGDYVTIGLNATVLPNLIIEEGAFIGAGAVVIENVKKNEMVAGNPAKFLKYVEHKVDLKIFK
tara:strand:- start:1192 stop:1878 length:687 start_codon:yes stop_codon:yes gene_type:complete